MASFNNKHNMRHAKKQEYLTYVLEDQIRSAQSLSRVQLFAVQ